MSLRDIILIDPSTQFTLSAAERARGDEGRMVIVLFFSEMYYYIIHARKKNSHLHLIGRLFYFDWSWGFRYCRSLNQWVFRHVFEWVNDALE